MLMCTLTEREAVTFEAQRRPQNLSLEGQHKRPETPEGCSRVGGCGESQLDRADQRSDDLLNVGLWKKITTTTSNRRSFFWLRLFLVFHTQTRLRTHTQKNTPSSSRSVILTTALQPAAKIAVWRCHNNIFFFFFKHIAWLCQNCVRLSSEFPKFENSQQDWCILAGSLLKTIKVIVQRRFYTNNKLVFFSVLHRSRCISSRTLSVPDVSCYSVVRLISHFIRRIYLPFVHFWKNSSPELLKFLFFKYSAQFDKC